MRDFKFLSDNNNNDPDDVFGGFFIPVRNQNLLDNNREYCDAIISFVSNIFHTDAFSVQTVYTSFDNGTKIEFMIDRYDSSSEYYYPFYVTFVISENYDRVYNLSFVMSDDLLNINNISLEFASRDEVNNFMRRNGIF
jgi:hypothetical protein